MYTEVFPTRLKKAREYHGITQNEAANVLKIGASTYRNYESGHRTPNIESIALLARLYDVTSDWLLGLSNHSGLNEMNRILYERERDIMLKKLEKEAEMKKRVWG